VAGAQDQRTHGSGQGRALAILRFAFARTRVGDLVLVWEEAGTRPVVHRVLLPCDGCAKRVDALFPGAAEDSHPAILELADSLARFLGGEELEFSLSDVALGSCSAFQRSVLIAEYGIPRGRVSTYGRIAAHLGNPHAARAVGRALATNPFPIIIPCHRAVRSDGSLGGYQGGASMKRALLELEGLEFDGRGRIVKPVFHY
jgi:methylated-DNA-[protein]-cysteine S-methyltransferase